MKRTFERKLIYIASGWQLLSGLITTFIYSFYVRNQVDHFKHLSYIESRGFRSIFDSLYSFIITYGLFFIIIAILNIIIARKLLKDNTIHYKIPIYWFVLAIVFYFLTDYISLMLSLIASVIAMSKNKAIKEASRVEHLMKTG